MVDNVNLCKRLREVDKTLPEASQEIWDILWRIDESLVKGELGERFGEYKNSTIDPEFIDCSSALREVVDMKSSISSYAETILDYYFFDRIKNDEKKDEDLSGKSKPIEKVAREFLLPYFPPSISDVVGQFIPDCYFLTDEGRKCGQILDNGKNKDQCFNSCKEYDLCSLWIRYLVDNVPTAATVTTVSFDDNKVNGTVKLENGYIDIDGEWIYRFGNKDDEEVKERMISSACRIIKSGKVKFMTIKFDAFFPEELSKKINSIGPINLLLPNGGLELQISFPELKFIDGSYFVTEKNWKFRNLGRNWEKLIGTLNF
jgi:hypothetical protein